MQALIQLFNEMPTLLYVVVGILSLCVGSFLNVVIYRLPKILENEWKEEAHYFLNPDQPYTAPSKFTLSIPASTCPHCQHRIRWYENIPVISWLILLRGKCSQCKNPISFRYPFVELATMFCSLVVVYYFGFSLAMIAGVIFTWILIALTGIDFDTQLLPDRLVFPLLGLGLAVNSVGLFVSPVLAIWGCLFGFLSLWTVYILFKLLTGKEGMGYGDFKLLAALGAWLGPAQLPNILLISAVVGCLVGGYFLLKYKESRPFAFGPYLAIAGWICFLWGHQLMNGFFRLVAP